VSSIIFMARSSLSEYLDCSSQKHPTLGGRKTGFHLAVLSLSAFPMARMTKPAREADSCVLLLNISGGEVGRCSVYAACRISRKTPRSPGPGPSV
jgi:hypothetical protein